MFYGNFGCLAQAVIQFYSIIRARDAGRKVSWRSISVNQRIRVKAQLPNGDRMILNTAETEFR